MIGTDRDALLCDLAETYHIFDFRALPVLTLAALCFGLREDSRIKMKMAGMRYIPPLVLFANIADNLTLIRHGLFAKKNAKLPKLYTDMMMGPEPEEHESMLFASGEDFEIERKRILARAL